MLKKVNNLYLDEKEINFLNKYHLNYLNAKSYAEIMLLIDLLDLDEEDEDLEEISKSISERNYYLNTK